MIYVECRNFSQLNLAKIVCDKLYGVSSGPVFVMASKGMNYVQMALAIAKVLTNSHGSDSGRGGRRVCKRCLAVGARGAGEGAGVTLSRGAGQRCAPFRGRVPL